MRRVLPLVIVLLSAQSARAEPAKFALQTGWWSLRADFTAPSGIYGAIGVPWILFTPLMGSGEHGPLAAFDAQVGMQFRLNKSLRLRAGVQDVSAISRLAPGETFGGWDFQPGDRPLAISSFVFLNVGLRYEHSSGFVAGLDLPLFALLWDYVTPRLGAFYNLSLHFPFTLLFGQFYAGYAWSF